MSWLKREVCFILCLVSLICSSRQDSEDFSCSEDGALRLVGEGRRKSSEGRVEVCKGGSWGTVCDDDWDNRDAAVVCGLLGYHRTNAIASKYARFGGGDFMQAIVIDNVRCTGLESTLLDCPSVPAAEVDCHHTEDAGVICEEDTCEEGDVRLMDGSDAKEGRVEICHNNTWGTVCDTGWDNDDAEVVCRQLGLRTVDAMALRFGPGTLEPFIKDVECSGDESTLSGCTYHAANESDHSCYPAGVICDPPCLVRRYSSCSKGIAEYYSPTETCFCSQQCYTYGRGACCRDILYVSDCFDTPRECTDNNIRLVNGTEEWNGRLEVCLHGHWGAVCEDRFENIDAAVACKNLGFSSDYAFAVPGGTFGGSDLMWLRGVECRGVEDNLTLCQHHGPGHFLDCMAHNSTGLWCAGEAPEPECPEGDVRLVGGLSPSDGRVEVCHGGVWGSICAHDWDDRETRVVCSQIGINGSYIDIPSQLLSPGTGPIVLEDLQCVGNEGSLLECERPEVMVRNCYRSQEVGVSCKEDIQRCNDLQQNSSLTTNTILQYGDIFLYTGSSAICNLTYVPYEDYIYLPKALGLEDESALSEKLAKNIGSAFSTSSSECQELFSKYICNSVFFRYKNDTGQPTISPLCAKECSVVQNTCPELWRALKDTELGRRAECNRTGSLLEPLPYCCIGEGIKDSQDDSGGESRSNVAVVSATVAVVIVLLVVAAIIVGGFVFAGKRIKKLERGLIDGREAAATIEALTSLHSRREANGKLSGTEELFSLNEADNSPIDISRYSRRMDASAASAATTLGLQTTIYPTLSPISSRYLRQLTSDMLISNSQLRLLDSIGTGEFGIVYKAHFLQGLNKSNSRNVMPKIVAVKTLKGFFDKEAIHVLLEESVKMKEFNHPNVLTLIGVCVDAGPAPYIVMPYMAKGSLQSYLKKQRHRLILSEEEEEEDIEDTRRTLLDMCNQIAKGMAYLAEKKFVHRDLATRNCMMDGHNVIRVSDFGLSEDMYAKNYFRQDKDACVKLPVKWMAPESLNDGLFTEKSDVWSFGITCWEVFNAGKTPYPGVNPVTLVRMLEGGERLEKPVNAACPKFAYDLMLKCWDIDPEKRPAFSEIAKEIEHVMEMAAGYLEMCTIAQTVRQKSPASSESPELNNVHSSSTSELLIGLKTEAGITIQLDQCSDGGSSPEKHRLKRDYQETSV